MAGRPPRTEEVKGVYIRIPPTLVDRVGHCQWLLQRQQGPRVSVNDAFWKIIEAGCEVLERTLEGSETLAPVQRTIASISNISPISISKLSDIAGDDLDMPGYGFPEDEEEMLEPQRNGAAQVADTEQAATPAPVAVKTAPTKRTQGIPQHIQVIAEARAEYEKLTLAEFAQLLYDRKLYRAKDRKTGEEKPVNRGTLQHWLEEAREAGVL